MFIHKKRLVAEFQIVNESTKQPAGIVFQQLRLTMQVIHQSEYFEILPACSRKTVFSTAQPA
jgi:hypothetical protein